MTAHYLSAVKLVISLFVLQAVVVPHLRVGNAQPDLLLLLAAAYGFYRGPVAGAGAGFASGLLQDLLTTQVMGLQAFTKCVTGSLCGTAQRTWLGESFVWHASAGFVVSLTAASVHYALMFIVGFEIPSNIGFFEVIVPSAVYNAVVAVFFFRLVADSIEPRSEFARAA